MNFILGNFLALFFREQLRAEPRRFFHPYLAAGLLFEGFFYVPLGIYLYYFYPAWSWMYFFDPASLNPTNLAVLGVIMASCYLLSMVLGFQLARFLVRRGKDRAAVIIMALGLIGLGAFCLLTLNRLLWVGDYLVWKNHSGDLLLKHRLSWINTLMAVTGFASLAVLLRKLKGSSLSLSR